MGRITICNHIQWEILCLTEESEVGLSCLIWSRFPARAGFSWDTANQILCTQVFNLTDQLEQPLRRWADFKTGLSSTACERCRSTTELILCNLAHISKFCMDQLLREDHRTPDVLSWDASTGRDTKKRVSELGQEDWAIRIARDMTLLSSLCF